MTPRGSNKGFNTLDLLDDLSPSERTLTRLLLRHTELTEDALHDLVAQLPQEKHLNKTEIRTALKALIQKEWVFEIESDGRPAYTMMQQKHHQPLSS